jgi:phage terminase large subunit-like protein
MMARKSLPSAYVGFAARAPALAIADFVRRSGGAVYSSEILDMFHIGYSSLKRRRLALRRLGIVFVENGAGSFYATEDLARQLPHASPSVTDRLSTATDPLPTKNGVSAAT